MFTIIFHFATSFYQSMVIVTLTVALTQEKAGNTSENLLN